MNTLTFEVKKNNIAEMRRYFHLTTTILTLLAALFAAIYLLRHRVRGDAEAMER